MNENTKEIHQNEIGAPAMRQRKALTLLLLGAKSKELLVGKYL